MTGWPAYGNLKSRLWPSYTACKSAASTELRLPPTFNDYFTSEALADFQGTLAPLGEPLSFRQTSELLRGGMTFRAFEIDYPAKRLTLTTYTYRDGKLKRHLIAPAE